MSNDPKKPVSERPLLVPREIVPVIRVTSVLKMTVINGLLTTVRLPKAA
jgi:hypothetical protein